MLSGSDPRRTPLATNRRKWGPTEQAKNVLNILNVFVKTFFYFSFIYREKKTCTKHWLRTECNISELTNSVLRVKKLTTDFTRFLPDSVDKTTANTRIFSIKLFLLLRMKFQALTDSLLCFVVRARTNGLWHSRDTLALAQLSCVTLW